jgi:hypothetical protein
MPDVQDIDCVAAHSIENLEWVANDGGHPYLRTLRNAPTSFRQAANTFNNGNESALDRLSYPRAGVGGIIGREPFKIGERAPRIDEPHPE